VYYNNYIDVLRIQWIPFRLEVASYINLKPDYKTVDPPNGIVIYKFTGNLSGYYTSIYCKRDYETLYVWSCISEHPIVENTLNIIIDDSISLNDNFNHQITKNNIQNSIIKLTGDARLYDIMQLNTYGSIKELFNVHVYGKLTPSGNYGKITINPIVQREDYYSPNDGYSFYGTMIYPFNHSNPNSITMKKITVKMISPSTCTLTITNEDYTS
jgi:hypothetical protein